MTISFLYCKPTLATFKRTSKTTNYNWPARNTFCLWQVSSYPTERATTPFLLQEIFNGRLLIAVKFVNASTTFTFSQCTVMLIIASFRINVRKFYPPIIGCYRWNDITLPKREKPIRRFKRALYTRNYLAQYQFMLHRHRYIYSTVICISSLVSSIIFTFSLFLRKNFSKKHIINILSNALVPFFTLIMTR